jgi:hypothetical protein
MSKIFQSFEVELLADDSNTKEVEAALLDMGPVKINNVCKSLGLSKKGRKVKNVTEIMQAVEDQEIDLADVIDVYNAHEAIKGIRVKKAQNAFKVLFQLFDAFKDVKSFDEAVSEARDHLTNR